MQNGNVVGAVIQARVGSSRFPRKVFADICGRPLLGHILDRLKRCTTLDRIVIATSTQPGDAELLAFAEAEGVSSFAGDENDVQKRYIEAAEKFGLDIVVRICGDSPFIDPRMTDRLVTELVAANADYAEPDPETPGAYEGAEAVTLAALRRARELGDDGPDREHVTWYIRRHPAEFRVIHPQPDPTTRGKWRLSIDTRADLDFVRSIFGTLHRPGDIFDATALAALLREQPFLTLLNAHVRQKPADLPSPHVGLYVETDHDISAAVSLARRLNEWHHCGVCFLGPFDEQKRASFAAMGYGAQRLASLADDTALAGAIEHGRLAAIVAPARVLERAAPHDWPLPVLSTLATPEQIASAARSH